MKVGIWIFVLSCIVFSVPAGAVIITPSDTDPPVIPGTNELVLGSAGDRFHFDFLISDPTGVTAVSLQTTINVSGPGILTFDAAFSEAVESDPCYWVYNNSIGAAAIDRGSNNYEFGDGADDPYLEDLVAGEIVARYAFTWDGTEGDYTFTIDLNTSRSHVLDDSFTEQTLEFTPGLFDSFGGSDYFTLHITPEPATMLLFGLGGLFLRKKRKT